MIYCNLKGGLGNMLFQIAATISISKDNNQNYSFPNLYGHLHYLDRENTYNPKLNYSTEYLQLLHQLNVDGSLNGVKTYSFPFEYSITPLINGDAVIDGFFQSEKYFKHNRESVLSVLDFKDLKNNPIINNFMFGVKKYTSIHVRRGDYSSLTAFYHQLTKDYYDSAIQILKDKTDVFLIFSDDIKECKEIFKDLENAIFIENEKDYVELYLMSLCDYNIIANSSFSWWGAWLNKNENKIVIGPSKWFGPSISHNTGDIIPENWIKI